MRTLFALTALLLLLAPGCSQPPPIIDRELFFGDPQISNPKLSPDGSLITFVKPFKGVRNIWVKTLDQPFDKAHPITADTARPILQYFWSRDGKYVLYVQDKGGDENYHVYALNPQAAGDPVPAARDLTPLPSIRAMIYDVPKSKPDQIIVGLNDRRADLHDVYRLNLTNGEKTLLWKNDQNVAQWVTDVNGDLRAGTRQTPDGGWELLRIQGNTLVPFYTVTSDEDLSPLRFTPDGKKLYIITNKGASLDRSELQLCDVTTGEGTRIDTDPLNEVDIADVIFSDVSEELLATVYIGDQQRLYPHQKQFGEAWSAMCAAIPKGEIEIASMTADENTWLVSLSSDTDPGSRYIYHRKTGKAELLYRSRPDLPSEQLAPMTALTYTARDGMAIHAYLVTPKGMGAEKLPTVIMPHGGPWARDTWGYYSLAQFLANRGYAVFMPNFRGSTGYGKRYLNAGNKQWGTGSMQHDLTDGVRYLIDRKIADPKRVGIFGGSYGGFATLAGVAFTPDLYAAGVSYVGPSNLITLLKTIPPYWGPMKRTFAIRVGDIENPEDVKMLESQSPLNAAKSITAPLLVIQGANDPRVKKAESDQIVVALRDLGRTVEYMVAPDEGHGFAGRENRLAAFTALEKFLAKHLGGRQQDAVPADIQKKIDAMMVDIKSVNLQH